MKSLNSYSACQEKHRHNQIQFSSDPDFPLLWHGGRVSGAMRGGVHPPIMVTSAPALIGGQTSNSNSNSNCNSNSNNSLNSNNSYRRADHC